MKKFIFPLIIVIIIIVLVVVSKFNQKPSGKDLYISFEEEETSEEDKYIDGVYESVVKPNFEVKVDDSGNKIVITNDSEVSIDEGSKEILIKNNEGNIEVVKIADLLDGHSPTNNNEMPERKELNDNNSVSVLVYDHLGNSVPMLVPEEVAYDTVLVNRNGVYAGVLYGKYLYRLDEDIISYYSVDTAMIIASYSSDILLGQDEEGLELWLVSGQLEKKGSFISGGEE